MRVGIWGRGRRKVKGQTQTEGRELPRWVGRLRRCHLVGKDRQGCASRPAGTRTHPTKSVQPCGGGKVSWCGDPIRAPRHPGWAVARSPIPAAAAWRGRESARRPTYTEMEEAAAQSHPRRPTRCHPSQAVCHMGGNADGSSTGPSRRSIAREDSAMRQMESRRAVRFAGRRGFSMPARAC